MIATPRATTSRSPAKAQADKPGAGGSPTAEDAREALDSIRQGLAEPPSIFYFLDEETLEQRVHDLLERKLAEAALRRSLRDAEFERARKSEFDLDVGEDPYGPSPEEEVIRSLDALVRDQEEQLERVMRDAERAATHAHLSLGVATVGDPRHGRLLRPRSVRREARPRVRRCAARRALGARSASDPGGDDPPGPRSRPPSARL